MKIYRHEAQSDAILASANARDYTKINSPINFGGAAVKAGTIKQH